MDIALVRAQFPGLAAATPLVLLDNAGGSQTLKTVATSISEYLLSTNVQLGASYETSVTAGNRVKAGTTAGAHLINARFDNEVLFASSTTQAFENVARAMGPTLKPGQEIIVTNFDHEANVGTWVRMANNWGAVLKFWEIDRETLRPNLATLQQLLSPNTRLVCLTHASNILGSINDIKTIAAAVHAIPGAEVCVDGVAFAPHRAVDVQDLNADFYAFSLYKVYGPHQALLYCKREALQRLNSINHHFIDVTDPEHVEYKLQPGAVQFELTAAVPAIVEYLAGVGNGNTSSETPKDRADIRAALIRSFEHIAAHEELLAKTLLDFLASKKEQGVRVIGEPVADRTRRVPTISFVIAERKSCDLVPLVDAAKYGIRWGHFYSKRLIDYLGLDVNEGIIRVSMVHYNTVDEVLGLTHVLDKLI